MTLRRRGFAVNGSVSRARRSRNHRDTRSVPARDRPLGVVHPRQKHHQASAVLPGLARGEGSAANYKWPYHPVSLPFEIRDKGYGNGAPGDGASDPVARGFRPFVQTCVSWNSVSLVVGELVRELNVPRNVAEYPSPIISPSSTRRQGPVGHARRCSGLPVSRSQIELPCSPTSPRFG